MNVSALGDAGFQKSMPEGGLEAAIGDGPRALRDKGVSAPANGCRKEPQRGAVGAPVIAKHVNSRDRKGDVAVAPPFAVCNPSLSIQLFGVFAFRLSR